MGPEAQEQVQDSPAFPDSAMPSLDWLLVVLGVFLLVAWLRPRWLDPRNDDRDD